MNDTCSISVCSLTAVARPAAARERRPCPEARMADSRNPGRKRGDLSSPELDKSHL